MRYGLIGEHLAHSYSSEIHKRLGGYEYTLTELSPSELDGFMLGCDFEAVNVTIPYKSAVLPYLSYTDESARVGAVNTVLNRNGKLCGYNTDLFGLRALIARLGLELRGKKVLILGTGGTSRTAAAVATELGAASIIKVSRTEKSGAITYDEACREHSDAEIIINTTPCGMYPSPDATPIDISHFSELCGVVDAVYNPIRTNLVLDAQKRGIPAEGGLYMLVAQAAKASELFTGRKLPHGAVDAVFGEMLAQKQSIVLTGMPGSGKSTVGRALAQKLGKDFFDSDIEIVKRTGREITELFRTEGEAYFRALEEEVIKDICAKACGAVIATGGGAVLSDRNIRTLSRVGCIYFLDRPLESLMPSESRPIAKNAEQLRARYEERYERYLSTCDRIVKNRTDVESAVNSILDT